MSDEALMSLVQEGDDQAFKVLFDKYKRPIMSYVYQFHKRAELVEEITHEVFLKVYKSRASYRSEYKFSTWLWTIAKNTSLDRLRKKKESLMQDYSEHQTIAIEQVESDETSIDEKLIAKANQDILEKCFENLNDNYKEALSLRVYSELSYDEISELLGASLGAVKTYINRAKSALVECVKDCMEKQK